MMLFPLYISFNGRSRSFFSKTGGGGGGGGGEIVRFLYAVNVVILLIFFVAHNDTSVVWISKTVRIDENYFLKLETFLIRFDEGKGTCMRSSERGKLFPGNKKKKQWSKKSGIYQHYFSASCHAIKLKKKTDSIGLKPRIIEKIYTNLAKSFFQSQIFSTE